MKERIEKPKIIRFNERDTNIEIDGDTVRIQLPGKDRSVAYEIQKVSEKYWALKKVLPTALTIDLQNENNVDIDTPEEAGSDRTLDIPVDLNLVAKEYGLTREEYDLATTYAERVLERFKLKPLSFKPSSTASITDRAEAPLILSRLATGEMLDAQECGVLERLGYIRIYEGKK